jgi:hypothetical protein
VGLSIHQFTRIQRLLRQTPRSRGQMEAVRPGTRTHMTQWRA